MNATMLPERVKVPMKIDNTAEKALAPPTASAVVVAAPFSMTLNQINDDATRVEAKPPEPLNSATISGIEVISTRVAAMAPIALPMTRPSRIHWRSNVPISIRVATTAISMASAAMALPRWAERTRVRPFKPKMKSTAESR